MSPDTISESQTAHISVKTPLIPAINAWQVYLEDQGKSPHTVKAFSHDMELLASFLPPDRPLGEITTTELNNFLQWMKSGRGVPCSPKTFARRITSIKAFFRWLHKYGVVAIDPSEKLVQKSVVSPLPIVLTPQEVDVVMEVAEAHRRGTTPDARYYTLVSLLLNTGIKKSECLALSLNHIDVDSKDGAILFVRYNNPQYRYKERKIPLPQDWIEAFQEYQNQYRINDQLFPWSPRRLEYLLEDLSQEAGLEKHLSFDMCRWTCALIDWEAGEEHNKIRQKLGISKIQWREVRMKLEKLSSDLV
jgi:site-specific recombinase XerD